VKSVVIENTDVRVSRLSFGTASLHHVLTASQRLRLLAVAADQGITHFDTSPYYGDGLAELELGAFISKGRSSRTVATKVGIYPRAGTTRSGLTVWLRRVRGRLHPRSAEPVVDWGVRRARISLRDSLKRLRTDYVDFLFLHEPDLSLMEADGIRQWLEDERSRGTIRFWGLAGVPSLIEPWLQADSALAAVVQTRDDLESRSADVLRRHNRRLQFTYGYLSVLKKASGVSSLADVMEGALRRNSDGSVLVSTRHADRLVSIASFAQ
jgi:aryl-alcohol dehydrogenase-like predicted oxidoreductase